MGEQWYIEQIKNLKNPTFQQIRDKANESISYLSETERSNLYYQLKRGVKILETHEELCQYLYSFGKMHEKKIHFSVKKLPLRLLNSEYNIIDWGCGQGIATICFFDFLNERNININAKQVKLIEPGKVALDRAKLHISQYIDKNKIQTYNKFFEEVEVDEIKSDNIPTIHFFSNILDIEAIDLKELASKITSALTTDNYLVTVGPTNATNQRIDWFYEQYFMNTELLLDEEDRHFYNKWTLKAKVYKLEYNEEGNLVPIELYPSVQFHSAYQLDIIKKALSKTGNKYALLNYNLATSFEVSAPFDLGASVYDDIDPILAVLNNIITRGLPTKASVFIEEKFQNAYKLVSKKVITGEIKYEAKQPFEINEILLTTTPDFSQLNNRQKTQIELLYSPILIARIQKVIIEALLTNKLELKDKWQILVEEKDIPATALAIKDLEELFNNLCALSRKYKDRKFPKVELTIIGNDIFQNSPLHLSHNVYLKATNDILQKEYDLVLDIAFFEKSNIQKETFSKYKAKNKCYFNIRSAEKIKNERKVYTTDRIKYRDIVRYDQQGKVTEQKGAKKILTYFLQLLFRKQEFRPGQLPILHRALQNKAVIGLLPTGGGKSLTYQIAGLLQPGVTVIIDPLKSLMKDQFDGLINAGIDNCSYINSSLNRIQRDKVEEKLEHSNLLFIFLSPERLAIYKFRQRLKNMKELHIYFSYGVIDEVHCVSEWGHDFRFSYLHLGRNLYNYVNAKNGHISLFGLTATASFDVLADVERELSGNGAFPLDAETVVRHENTNRLELQYKIEKVEVEFREDTFFDQNNHLPDNFPRPVRISDKWTFYDKKKEFLYNYIQKVPEYIRELQSDETIDNIKRQFSERINLQDETEKEQINSTDLKVEMPDDFFELKDNYKQAGIVFCPHKNNTGISVNENVKSLKNYIKHVGKFYGGDDDDFMDELDAFRVNKKPLMIATKAFGMGIDKPNVRFTINLNYSSSLESFVQEAGRAGRDRKMALAVIFISDYKLVRINRKYGDNTFPLGMIKGKWFKPSDLKIIIENYNLNIEFNTKNEYLDFLSPDKDLIRITCNESGQRKYFGFNQCQNNNCPVFQNCVLRRLPRNAENWQYEKDLFEILNNNNLKIPKKYFEYQNADYETVMYFYNNNFKGPLIEKGFMVELLNKKSIEAFVGNTVERKKTFSINGFLETLSKIEEGKQIVSFIQYNNENHPDISKAIYRMTSIGLIEDFTQDYVKNEFRIVSTRHKEGDYFNRLQQYLERYYSKERAIEEIQNAKNFPIRDSGVPVKNEIYKCLGYLTDFVYDKISVKRKRAIDDMRNFCISGIDESKNWKIINEELKDFIYYYFNSKYAQSDYIAENGQPYSLTNDTENGKISNLETLFKYLKVIEPDIDGSGPQIDNVKHLQGAIRLIRRSLTDSNPTISLLNAFTLMFLGTKNNENLEQELENSYKEGMFEFYTRMEDKKQFWSSLLNPYNEYILRHTTFSPDIIKKWTDEVNAIVHIKEFNKIAKKYTE